MPGRESLGKGGAAAARMKELGDASKVTGGSRKGSGGEQSASWAPRYVAANDWLAVRPPVEAREE